MRTVYLAILDLIKWCVLNGKKLDTIAERQEQMKDTLEEILADVTLEVDPASDQGKIDQLTVELQASIDAIEQLIKEK